MMDVICRSCAGVYHETTVSFTEDISLNGGMFRLKEPYKSNGWSSFPEHSGVTGQAIECPNCGSPYADINGKLKLSGVDERDEDAVLVSLSEEGKTAGEIARIMGKTPQWVGVNLRRLRNS
jgi:translation initiation factor IF-1